MKKTLLFKVVLLIIFTYLSVSLFACQSNQMREYYSDNSNYVTATGTVKYISFNESEKSLYIDIFDSIPTFDDTCFKIVGENYDLVRERGMEDLLQSGDPIEFITAPKYFGDGYVMPIVSISVNGEMILEFDEGLLNFLDWLS